MDPVLILSSFRAGLEARRFTLAEAARQTGIPASTLYDLREGSGSKFADHLRRIARALPILDPLGPRRFFEACRCQAAIDLSRPVCEQIPDVERGLAMFGIEHEQLCARIKISPRTWSRWRAGVHEPTYSDWVRALEAAQTLIDLAEVDRQGARA